MKNSKPNRPCKKNGCPNFSMRGYSFCEMHQKISWKKNQIEREDDDSFYRSSVWLSLRSKHLRDEPLCRGCKKLDRVTAASMVDHILPIRDGGEQLDENNLQSLCESCHARKRAREGNLRRWRSKNGSKG